MGKNDNYKNIKLHNDFNEYIKNLPDTTANRVSILLLYKIIEQIKEKKNIKLTFDFYELFKKYDLKMKRIEFNEQLENAVLNFDNSVKETYINEDGERIVKKYAIFNNLEFNVNKMFLEVEVNKDFYNNIINNIDKYYFTFTEKELIKLVENKLKPNQLRFLIFIKSKSYYNKKTTFNITIEDLAKNLTLKTVRVYDIRKRNIEPSIKAINKETDYYITYDVIKEPRDKRKVKFLTFNVWSGKAKERELNKIEVDVTELEREPEQTNNVLNVNELLKGGN